MSLESDLQQGLVTHSTHLDIQIELQSDNTKDLLKQLRMMQIIRAAENKIAEMRKGGKIGGPVHLGAGQEAIAVGISKYLKKTDRVFSAHRSHAHLLALGSEPKALFAEVLGRYTGLSKGMGGSMHLWDQPNGFYGSVPIVAGTVPLAVGAGLAAKMQGTKDIAVAYFGDGAAEEGVVHESLNLASQLKIPILFVCENNLFSSHMHISQRQPLQSVARFAVANGIQHKVVDGNNLIEVNAAAEQLINSSRAGNGPVFIEAVTYRQYGHVDWRDDIDVGVNRSLEDLTTWRNRDPITRLARALTARESEMEQMILRQQAEVTVMINAAWDLAEKGEFPSADALLGTVYGKETQ
jgi:TPP-dependent pyruvate/acetoin dehydrogenase alpha subunit